MRFLTPLSISFVKDIANFVNCQNPKSKGYDAARLKFPYLVFFAILIFMISYLSVDNMQYVCSIAYDFLICRNAVNKSLLLFL